MANIPPGTLGLPANGNQDIIAIGDQDIPAIGDQGIPAFGHENVINNLLGDLLRTNFIQLQIIENNRYYAALTRQNPASSLLQAQLTTAIYLESFRASIKNRLDQLRQTAFRDLWHAAPPTVQNQILFQLKLVVVSPSLIIPEQIALSFFPPLVDDDHLYLTVTSIGSQWIMRYEYNIETNNFEFTSGWDAFLVRHSLRIGDYVFFSLSKSGSFSVDLLRRGETWVPA